MLSLSVNSLILSNKAVNDSAMLSENVILLHFETEPAKVPTAGATVFNDSASSLSILKSLMLEEMLFIPSLKPLGTFIPTHFFMLSASTPRAGATVANADASFSFKPISSKDVIVFMVSQALAILSLFASLNVPRLSAKDLRFLPKSGKYLLYTAILLSPNILASHPPSLGISLAAFAILCIEAQAILIESCAVLSNFPRFVAKPLRFV